MRAPHRAPTALQRGVRQWRRNAPLRLGALLLLALLVVFTLGPLLSPWDPYAVDFAQALQPPSRTHWFGTDDLGRDVLARVLHGGLVDLRVAFVCVLLPGVLGCAIGAASGFIGGRVDAFVMRTTDVFWAFPFHVLVIAIVGALGPGEFNLYLAFVLVNWISYARIVRGQVLVVRELEYVQAARLLGFSTPRIVARHVLPNALAPAIVFGTSDVVLTILAITSLSFLGLGIQPPLPEWGLMIADGRNFLTDAWWIATFPGLAIMTTGIAFAALGDGLDQATRPKE